MRIERTILFFVVLSTIGPVIDLEAQQRESRLDYKVLSAANARVRSSVSDGIVDVVSRQRKVAQGCVIDSEGWIVTKASEIENSPSLSVHVHDGRNLGVTVWGIDPRHDIALLKADDGDLTPIAWDTDFNLEPGVVVISPRKSGMSKARSIGIISVSPRPIGELWGCLGVELDARIARVTKVLPSMPAEKIGMRIGDIILRVGEVEVSSSNETTRSVKRCPPGQEVDFTIRRGDDLVSLKARLTRRPPDEVDNEDHSLEGRTSYVRSGFPYALQHDSPLSPEDCGGPLVSIDGRAIALNIARAGRVATYAIPAEVVLATAKKLMDQPRQTLDF